MFETKSRTLAGAALSLVVLAGLPAIAGEKLAVKAGRIVTRVGDDVTGGVIVIEGGKIKAVGAAGDVEAPWDAEVIDAPDLVAFPGFVEAHSYRGMDRSNENIDVAAFLDIRDSLDPVNFYFEDALRSGITTIGVQQGNACVIAGMGMVVRPWGMTLQSCADSIDPIRILSKSSMSSLSLRETRVQILRKSEVQRSRQSCFPRH
jgi:imidazolonepropionase-like amidohydrolase